MQEEDTWFWLYAVVEPTTGTGVFLLLLTVERHCLGLFLEHLRHESGETPIRVVLNSSGSHRRSEVRWPQDRHPLSLPPYRPELNPASQIFRHLRKSLSNAIFTTFDELQNVLIDHLQQFWERPMCCSTSPAILGVSRPSILTYHPLPETVEQRKETKKVAQQELLHLLKRGVLYWNQWRQEHPEMPLDLSRTFLSGSDLTGINLSRVNLTRVDLRAATLKMANLKEANCTLANLSAADLRMANLHAANLHAANLREADLREALLRAANLKVADLTSADIRGAVLDGAIFEMTILEKTKKRGGWWSFFS